MVTLKETKTPAARKKLLVGVCEEFKEKFGEELEPAIVTKGKTEKQLIGILKEVGKDALEKGDNISEQSEGIMLELGLLSKSYLKALKKAEKGKDAPEPKKGKKDKKAKEEPEPEEQLSKKEKKAAKKAAEKSAEKQEKSKQPVIKYSRYDAVGEVIAEEEDFKNLDDLIKQSNARYVEKTGKAENYNEAKFAAKNMIMALSHFPKVKFSIGE